MQFRSASETSALLKRYFYTQMNTHNFGYRSVECYVICICFSFSFQEVNSVYRILSAILNTGNIEFTAITSQHQTDKSEVPNSEALENGEIYLAPCVVILCDTLVEAIETCRFTVMVSLKREDLVM